MTSNNKEIDINELNLKWGEFMESLGLRPIRNEEDFKRIQHLANKLTDEIGDSENHPLTLLLDVVFSLIERWESANVSIEPSSPAEVLKCLMESNNLKPEDLSDIYHAMGIREILEGREPFTLPLVKLLAKRFNVCVSVFID